MHGEVGAALGTDYFHIRDELTDSEVDCLERRGGSSTTTCSR